MENNKSININISTSTVLKIIGVLLILAFAYFIRDIILIVFISILFAAVIEPLVNFLQDGAARIIKYTPPRGLVVIFIYLVLFLFLVFAKKVSAISITTSNIDKINVATLKSST